MVQGGVLGTFVLPGLVFRVGCFGRCLSLISSGGGSFCIGVSSIVERQWSRGGYDMFS